MNDLSAQLGLVAWLVSILANANRILRNSDAERQQLHLAKAAAEEASRIKSEFLASMSHELRTPLNAIIGFSDVMQKGMFGPIPERYRDYSSDIFQSGNHLLDLINEILDLSKLEAGKLELHEEEFDLALAVRVSMHLVEAQAQKSKVQLIDDIDHDLPRVRGDNRRVRQVLINLLSNAVKFTPEGGHIRVSAANKKGGLAIYVQDTGIGIAAAQVSKVLEPFTQIDSKLSRKHEGTGLGLPIAKRLVELHGGTLTIESELNLGTTVTLNLPHRRLLGQCSINADGGRDDVNHGEKGGRSFGLA
jgi:signal transduction histidine kinase